MNILSCPTCKEQLILSEKSYICINKHSYDISKEGYVNLFLHSKGEEKPSGDSKEMINARHIFLNKGYYDSLKNALLNITNKYSVENSVIVDIGCGEGYYTANISDFLANEGKRSQVFGFDISKNAIQKAAKRTENALFLVANAFEIPLFNNSANMLFSIFAPLAKEEFKRILKKDGYLIIVSPAKEHLFELKALLYEKPYLNEENEENIEGFTLTQTITESNIIYINNNEDINNLFLMTPYYWKTSLNSANKLKELNCLKTKTEFLIRVYKKR